MRHIWNRRRQTVVVDFSRGSIKMAAAESAEEAVRFRGITQIPLTQTGDLGELGDAEIASLIGKEVKRRGWLGMPAACLLSGSATSTQTFLSPPMPDADLRKAIALKLVDTLHFDVEEATFDFRRVRQTGSGGKREILTLVVAARKVAIQRALKVLHEAGLKPVAVGAAGESLANLTSYASLGGADDASIHVDIGKDSTILNLFEGRMLRFSREIDTAGETFTQALMRPIITSEGAVHLTHAQAEEVKASVGYPRENEDEVDLPHGIKSADILPLMEPVAQRLVAEIQRSCNYLCSTLKRKNVDNIVLSGSAGQMRNLSDFLEENLHTSVTFIDPVARAIAHWRLAIHDEDGLSPTGFSVILGYSLGNHRPINLLQGEEKLRLRIQEVTRVRKAIVPSTLALGTCLALAAVPMQRSYHSASGLLQSTSDHLDQRLARQAELIEEYEITSQVVEGVVSARGLLPDWVGLMKEVAMAFPEGAYITSFSAELQDGIPHIRLVARIREGSLTFGAVVTQLTVSLSTAPFFRRVHVIEASMSDEGLEGRFEVTMEVIAPSANPWESKP